MGAKEFKEAAFNLGKRRYVTNVNGRIRTTASIFILSTAQRGAWRPTYSRRCLVFSMSDLMQEISSSKVIHISFINNMTTASDFAAPYLSH